MKHFALSLLLACCSFSCMAQSWAPVVKGVKSNYGSGTTISYTVWVDSSSYSPADSTYHLNRVIAPCPNCPLKPYCTTMFLNNQGSVFLKDIRFMGQYIRLSGNSAQHPLYISTSKQLNTSWIYDSVANIRATITGLLQTVLWSQTDSIEQITLSNGQQIVLSKNHGILKFPDPWVNGELDLIGMEASVPLGVQTPMFNDLFSFNTGDLFEYSEEEGYQRSITYVIYSLCTLTSKISTPDSIHFDMHVNQMTRFYPGNSSRDTTYNSYDGYMSFYKSDSLYGAHIHMPIFHGVCEDYIPADLGWNSTFNCQTKGYNISPAPPNLMNQWSLDTLGLSNAPPVYSGWPAPTAYASIFGKGVGLIEYHSSDLGYPHSYIYDKMLIAAQINNQVLGNFISVMPPAKPHLKSSIGLYPNPCQGFTTVTFPDNITELRIYDTTGRLLSVSFPNAPSATLAMPARGIYFVRIYSGGNYTTEKVVSY